jgi:hypothetical protein
MRTYLLPLLLIAIALGLMIQAACAPIYVPPKVQAPLLSNAGEAHASAAFEIGGEGYDAQIAWSPYNHFGLYGGFSIAPTDSGLPHWRTHLRHTYGEMAAGWYTRTDEGTGIELLGGIGFGTTANRLNRELTSDTLPRYPGVYYDSELYVARGTYMRYVVQGDWGHTIAISGDIVTFAEGGFAVRAGWVQFLDLNDENGNNRPRGGGFLEPAAFIRGGSTLFQVEGEGGFSVLVGRDAFNSLDLCLRLGVHFMFGRAL